MKGLNKVMLIGNVGADPVLKTIEGDVKVARFSIATSESYKDENGKLNTSTEWHNIILWRGLASFAEKHVHKGSMLFVEGKIKTRSYEDKEGVKKYVTEIIAENINLLDKKEVV
jgi:single-strand DNA-binding protein